MHDVRGHPLVVPIEHAIRGSSPYVAEAVVFGTGRPQIGCIILPSDLGKELSEDREAFMKKIWPVVERANAEAPSHSQLLPEMIHILPYVFGTKNIADSPDLCMM